MGIKNQLRPFSFLWFCIIFAINTACNAVIDPVFHKGQLRYNTVDFWVCAVFCSLMTAGAFWIIMKMPQKKDSNK